MATSPFRLTTVLRLREGERDLRRGELAAAYRAEQALRERQAQLQGELHALKQHCRRMTGVGSVDVDGLIDWQRYELMLLAEQQSLAAQLQTLASEAEKRRMALVEADRQVRVVEQLRARHRERQRANEQRQEAKSMDEVAIREFNARETD